jgi:Domain of unknown function (DUF4397)
MKVCLRVVLSAALYLAVTSLAFGADDGFLFIVNGVPGRAITAYHDPSLPVDVLLNNTVCALRGADFGNVYGPLALPAGQYDIKISLANVFVPCSNPALSETSITVQAGRNTTAITALDQTGKPTLLTFSNNLSAVAANNSRIILSNAADAPQLQFTFQAGSQKYTYDVNPGQKVVATIPAGAYDVAVEANGTVLVPSQPLPLPSMSAVLVYSVGSASNNSVVLVTKTIRDVF